LGLSFTEIADLTPVELDCMIDQWFQQQDADNLRFGVIAATIAEPNRDKHKKPTPFTARDFFRPLSTPVESDPAELSDESRDVILSDFWTQLRSATRMKQKPAV
jgi:hypothetical protein